MSRKVRVILNQSGVKTCGQHKAGVEYQVEKEEADRLVNVKGFKFVNKTNSGGES